MKLRIKQMRVARGLTVERLAEMVGMSKSYVSELENGRKQINGRRLEAFAAALGVTVPDLLDDDSASEDIRAHLEILRRLSDEDRAAVLRHAQGLLPPNGG